jgi:acyl-CoA thioesterase
MVTVSELAGGATVWRLLGIELVNDDEGSYILRLPVEEKLLQYYGKVHGGVIATLFDAAAGIALNQEIDPEKGASTVEFKLNYLCSVEGGILYAKGKVVHLGQTLAVVKARVWDHQGRKVAFGMGTFYLYNLKDKTKNDYVYQENKG